MNVKKLFSKGVMLPLLLFSGLAMPVNTPYFVYHYEFHLIVQNGKVVSHVDKLMQVNEFSGYSPGFSLESSDWKLQEKERYNVINKMPNKSFMSVTYKARFNKKDI